MSTDASLHVPGLATADVAVALAELAAARDRVYYDAEADAVAADAYYRQVALEQYANLVARSHACGPVYEPARELYPWVNLQPSGTLRSRSRMAARGADPRHQAIAGARAQELELRGPG